MDIAAKELFFASNSQLIIEVIRPINNRLRHFGCSKCGYFFSHFWLYEEWVFSNGLKLFLIWWFWYRVAQKKRIFWRFFSKKIFWKFFSNLIKTTCLGVFWCEESIARNEKSWNLKFYAQNRLFLFFVKCVFFDVFQVFELLFQ